MVLIWIVVMALDYLSGTLAAWLSGEWSSTVAREGLKHKGGMILVVVVAGLADITLAIICTHLPVELTWPVLVLPLVLAWYILTELGSILENAVKMGAPIPQWLMRLLTVGLKAINTQADSRERDALTAREESVDDAVHKANRPPDLAEQVSE